MINRCLENFFFIYFSSDMKSLSWFLCQKRVCIHVNSSPCRGEILARAYVYTHIKFACENERHESRLQLCSRLILPSILAFLFRNNKHNKHIERFTLGGIFALFKTVTGFIIFILLKYSFFFLQKKMICGKLKIHFILFTYFKKAFKLLQIWLNNFL